MHQLRQLLNSSFRPCLLRTWSKPSSVTRHCSFSLQLSRAGKELLGILEKRYIKRDTKRCLSHLLLPRIEAQLFHSKSGLCRANCSVKFLKDRFESTSSGSPLLVTETKPEACRLMFGVFSAAPARKTANEDAWILLEKDDTCTIGVADGVSSWRRNGVKVEDFSNQLVVNISTLASKNEEQSFLSPVTLLDEAYRKMQLNKEAEGSCTVSFGVIDKTNHVLHAATVGDCGLRVIRGGKVVLRSQEQYVTNCVPFQLGILPHWCQSNDSCISFKSPLDADQNTFELQNNDLILFGSDGLFDNLWDDEILDILEPEALLQRRYDLNRAAESLVFYAHRNAYNGTLERPTPHAYKICGGCQDCMEEIFGGNVDDVTVCLALVHI